MLNWLPALFLLIAQGAGTTGEAPSRVEVWVVLSAVVQQDAEPAGAPLPAAAQTNAPTLAFWAHYIAASDTADVVYGSFDWPLDEGAPPAPVLPGRDDGRLREGFVRSARTRDGPRTV